MPALKVGIKSFQFRTCSVHGSVPREMWCVRIPKGRNMPRYICILCRRDRAKAYRIAHPELIKQRKHDDRIKHFSREQRTNRAWKLAHPEIWKARNRSHYKNNKDLIKAQVRQSQLKTKMEVLSHYSGGAPYCKICNEKDVHFLGLDHLNGGGKAHKRKIGGAGGYVYLWARKNEYPAIFQVLCHNCNIRKDWKAGKSRAAIQNAKVKLRVFAKYSDDGIPKCEICNETDIRILTIDHKNNDGAADRRALGIKNSSTPFYAYLDKIERRPDLQILCHNHNLGKRCLAPQA
jgi:hypothetical protein